MLDCSITVGLDVVSEVEDGVRIGLVEHNTAHAGSANRRFITIALKDEAGNIHGGLIGKALWNWLFIKLMEGVKAMVTSIILFTILPDGTK